MAKSRGARNEREGEGGGFSRREREIMDALYRLGKASAAEIREQTPDPPSTTAIRTLLSILEKKGHVRHDSDGTRYIYAPCVAREQMGRRALNSLLKTFFDDSVRARRALACGRDGYGSASRCRRLVSFSPQAQ